MGHVQFHGIGRVNRVERYSKDRIVRQRRDRRDYLCVRDSVIVIEGINRDVA